MECIISSILFLNNQLSINWEQRSIFLVCPASNVLTFICLFKVYFIHPKPQLINPDVSFPRPSNHVTDARCPGRHCLVKDRCRWRAEEARPAPLRFIAECGLHAALSRDLGSNCIVKGSLKTFLWYINYLLKIFTWNQ